MQRYRFLKTAGSIFKILAWIVLVAGIISSIASATIAGGDAGVLIAGIGIIYSIITWVFLLATRELFSLFIDVEENTRNTAERVTK